MNRKNPRHKEMKILCQIVSETRVGSQTFYWKIGMLLFLNRYSDVTERSRNLKVEDLGRNNYSGITKRCVSYYNQS